MFEKEEEKSLWIASIERIRLVMLGGQFEKNSASEPRGRDLRILSHKKENTKGKKILSQT